MNIMDKIGVTPMKAIKGQTGLYFKFADGCGSNSEPIELYFKPKFVDAGYELSPGTIKKVTWIEINVLWVGTPDFPDFDGGWKVQREGKYCTKEGQQMLGYLLGKLFLPMGEFNGVLPEMHKWLSEKAEFIGEHINTTLGKQVHASTYMPLKTIFDHMLETVQQDDLKIEDPMFLLNTQFDKYQNQIKAAVKAKYSHSAPENDEPEQDSDE